MHPYLAAEVARDRQAEDLRHAAERRRVATARRSRRPPWRVALGHRLQKLGSRLAGEPARVRRASA